ncbi:hypothetical protein [Aquimarina mytili]|uniref:Uncharacterized protein n=1 Tax=Aquimarina mytili TaxID=874423 RepID=A0A937DCU3_9FLAO|nr:hypothetical protein [Aquimarina mytili]MBL0685316.1 hypothetical protein [Aquimarina mytili]
MGFKIGLSLFMLFGFFFFRKIGPILVGKLKEFNKRSNTGLVEKAPFIFKFFTLFFKVASMMCQIYIVMIWTGFVTIPGK